MVRCAYDGSREQPSWSSIIPKGFNKQEMYNLLHLV
jgi:hypothetical protein